LTPDEKRTSKKMNNYLFKITVVGPDDKLLMDVLSLFDDPVVAVDGIRIGSTEVDFDTSEVHAIFMSPRHSALDILLTLTYKGASGAIIVLRESDLEIETMYRNEIRDNLGTDIPAHIVIVGSTMDKFKQTEILHIFDEVVAEILERKTKKGK
jgi:signal recognition particle receptor subunit beta